MGYKNNETLPIITIFWQIRRPDFEIMVRIKLPEAAINDIEVLIAEESLLIVDIIKSIQWVQDLCKLGFTEPRKSELFVPGGGSIE